MKNALQFLFVAFWLFASCMPIIFTARYMEKVDVLIFGAGNVRENLHKRSRKMRVYTIIKYDVTDKEKQIINDRWFLRFKNFLW